VVQPYRLIRGEKSDRLAIYSMGNFIANQNKEFTQLGVIFKMDLIREEDGRKRIADLTAWPTQTIRRPGPSGFRILPLEQVVANEARYGVPAAMLPGLRKNLTTMNDHLRSMLG
jgi:poly-gamma-glutamate synthesis protein (capsule biosynthesis protein)